LDNVKKTLIIYHWKYSKLYNLKIYFRLYNSKLKKNIINCKIYNIYYINVNGSYNSQYMLLDYVFLNYISEDSVIRNMFSAEIQSILCYKNLRNVFQNTFLDYRVYQKYILYYIIFLQSKNVKYEPFRLF